MIKTTNSKIENFIKEYVNIENYHTIDIMEGQFFTNFLIKLLKNFENIIFIKPKKFIEYDFLFSKIFNNFNSRNFKDLCILNFSKKDIKINYDSFRNHIFYDLDNKKLLIFVRISLDKKESDNVEELVKETKKVNKEIKNMLNKLSKYKVESLIKKYDKDFIIKELDNVIHLTLLFGISIDFENFTKILKLDKSFTEIEDICFGGFIFIVNNKLIEFNELLDFFKKIIYISERDIEINDKHIFIYPKNSIKIEIVEEVNGKIKIIYTFDKIKKIIKPITKVYNISVITEKQLELLQKSIYLYLRNILNKNNIETSLQKLLRVIKKVEKETRIIDFLIS